MMGYTISDPSFSFVPYMESEISGREYATLFENYVGKKNSTYEEPKKT